MIKYPSSFWEGFSLNNPMMKNHSHLINKTITMCFKIEIEKIHQIMGIFKEKKVPLEINLLRNSRQ